MSRVLVRQIDAHAALYSDERTGIAWVENGHVGTAHTAHPNISASGSIRGMKARGWWGPGDRCVRVRGFIYNIDLVVVSDDCPYDQAANAACRCGGKHIPKDNYGR